jgi:hypothetical protein
MTQNTLVRDPASQRGWFQVTSQQVSDSLAEVTIPHPPTTAQWTTSTDPNRPGSNGRLTIALAVIGLIAVAALVVGIIGLTRSTSTTGARPSPATSPAAPTYTAAEAAAAHQKLCDVYKLAAHAVQIETNGTNPALAGIATVNGAVMLEEAVNSSPAIAPGDRAAALALAEAYSNIAALGSSTGGDDPAWRSALNDANAKDSQMQVLCGGG